MVKRGKSKCHNFLFYNRQVTTQGLGAGPVNLPTTSADQQFLNAGAEMAARVTEDITRTANDTAMQGLHLIWTT